MTAADLATHYRRYLACLDARRFEALDAFVEAELEYNGKPLSRADYAAMLADDCAAIPDLRFVVDRLVVDGPQVACRLAFRCTLERKWRGHRPSGKAIEFVEHVFYDMPEGRIRSVRSLLDERAIERQLGAPAR